MKQFSLIVPFPPLVINMKLLTSREKEFALRLAIPLIAILIWFFVKVVQFQTNEEDLLDGFIALQLSRGWLEGRPLLFDTFYGFHAHLHNYYFILPVGFVTKFAGVYGLFIVYLSLLFLFFWQWSHGFRHFPKSNWSYNWVALLFFAFGPMAYFIYLDFVGWHPEQYLIPLSALLSLSIARRQYFAAAIWFSLALSVKESAIVLLCSLLLFISVTDSVLKKPGQPWYSYYLTKRNGIIALGSLFIFCVGVWWLSYLNGSNQSRLGQALAHVHEHVSLKRLFMYSFSYVIVALITCVIAMFPFFHWIKISTGRGAILLALLGCYSLLFLVFLTESLLYIPSFPHGISYPARVGGLWGLMMSCYVFLSYRIAESGKDEPPRHREWIFAGVILQAIFGPILVSNAKSTESAHEAFYHKINYLMTSRLGLFPYRETLSRTLHDLSKKLPEGSEVVVPADYLTYFQNVYPYNWDLGGSPKLLGRPLIFIYEKEKISKANNYVFPKTGYTTIQNDKLLIRIDSLWYSQNFR